MSALAVMYHIFLAQAARNGSGLDPDNCVIATLNDNFLALPHETKDFKGQNYVVHFKVENGQMLMILGDGNIIYKIIPRTPNPVRQASSSIVSYCGE